MQLRRTFRAREHLLALPAAKLLETKQVKTKGQNRGTKYFAA